MFGSIKKMLGIEDVRIELIIPEAVKKESGVVGGVVKITTLNDSAIESIAIKLIEKYIRGRKEAKLIDEYIIGFIDLDERIDVSKDEILELPFELPFKLTHSEMDVYEDKNFLFGGLVKAAKALKGVKSEYRIEAEAFVKGTKLHPLSKKDIILK